MLSGRYVWLSSLKYNDSNHNCLCLPTYTASHCVSRMIPLSWYILTSERVLLKHIFIIRMISGVPSLSISWDSIFFWFAVVSYGLIFVSSNSILRSMKTSLPVWPLCYLQCTEIELDIHRKCSANMCLNMFYMYNFCLHIFMTLCVSECFLYTP